MSVDGWIDDGKKVFSFYTGFVGIGNAGGHWGCLGLSLRLSDFIRDLDGYEKDLLEHVERTDIADVTAEQMEQHLGDPCLLYTSISAKERRNNPIWQEKGGLYW